MIRAVYAKAQGDQGEFDDGGGSGAYLNFQIVALGNSFKIEDLSGNPLAAASAQKIVFDTPSQDDPPVAFFDGFFTDEDGLFAGNVINNTSIQPDVDPEGFAVRVVGFGEDLIWEEDEYDFNGGVVSTTGSTTFVLTSGAVVEINSAGDFTYNPSPAFDYLALGESAVDSFSYLIADPGNFTDSDTVEVTVYGRNDQPAFAVIDNSAGGAGDLVYETDASLGDALGQPAAISGSFAITDVDTTDVVTATVTSVAAAVVAASGAVAATASGDGIVITSSDGTTVTTTPITQADLLSFMNLSDVDGDTTGPDAADASSPTALPPTITILSDGETADTLNWNFDSIAETFDFLGLGETLELTYTVQVADNQGVDTASASDGEVSSDAALSFETITILITGTNDAPEIAVVDNTAGTDAAGDSPLYETDAALAASGSFTITDIDVTDVVTATVTGVTAAVTASDSGRIAVTTAGDLDQVSITGDVDGARIIDNATLLSFMNLSDVDGDTTGPDAADASSPTALPPTITILSDGETADTLNWNFDSIAETFDFLGLGETLELTYTVQVADNQGVDTASASDGEVSSDAALSFETITILITGTNDAPEIAVVDNTAGTDAAGDSPLYETDAALAASGSFTITDIDVTDVVTATVTGVTAAVTASDSGRIAVTTAGDLDQVSITGDVDGARIIDNATLLSFMNLSDVDGDTTGPDAADASSPTALPPTITILSDGETADTLNWNFDSIAETFDFLGLGETLELTYTVQVADNQGVDTASASDGEVSSDAALSFETITILITGTNDAPEIAVVDNTAGTDAAGDSPLYETDAALAASGSFTITDIDVTDVVTATVTGVTAAVTASDSGRIAVTTAGDLDQVSITGDVDGARIIDNATLLSFMNLSDVDGDTTGPDAADASSPTALPPTITILSDGETADTLNWNFDSIAETFDFLGLGETLELTYTVQVADNQGVDTASASDGEVSSDAALSFETITILITGTNDAPEIAVVDNTAGTDAAGDSPLYETDAALAASGSFTITDIDVTDVVTATVTGVTAAVTASDSGRIAVTTAGDLDQVSITGDVDGARIIDNATLLSFMNLSDVDGDTTGPDAADASSPTALPPTITILSDGETADTLNWNFDSIAETFDFLGLGETLELTYTVQVADNQGVDTASASDGEVSSDAALSFETITILITGTNDAPEIAVVDNTAGTDAAGDSPLYETDAALAASGSFTITDIDVTDVVTATVTGVTAAVTASDSGRIAVTTAGDLDQVSITGDVDGARIIDNATLLSFMNLSDVDGDTTGPDAADASSPTALPPTITILSDGETADTLNWNFDSIAETFDFLGLGETLELTYTVQVADNQGVDTASASDGEVSSDAALSFETITILITGTNDAPEIAVVDNTAGTDAAGDSPLYETDAALAASGSFTITDIDVTDVVTATVTGVTAAVTASDSGRIAVTTAGDLDQVSITGDVDGARIIDNATLLSFMNLSDVDGDTTGPDAADASSPTALPPTITILSDGETADTLNWNFDSIAETFDFLGLGETLELTYTVQVADNQGVDTASASDGEVSSDAALSFETITILITGTNDAPEIAVVDNTAGTDAAGDSPLYETDAALAASGSFTITDIDVTDVVTATVTGVTAAVTASDSGRIAVTTAGDLDQVSITGDVDGARIIDNATLLSFMNLSDVDGDTTGPDAADASSPTALPPTITILSDGETADTLNWNFDSIAETFDFLGLGETLELTYTVQVADNQGVDTASASDGEVSSDAALSFETITILITGTNDAPETGVAITDQTATVNSAFNFAVPGDAFTDVDASDTLVYNATLTGGASLPTWLTFEGSTGTFTGTPLVGDGLAGNLSVDITASDGTASSAAQTFIIEVAPDVLGTPGADAALDGNALNNLIVGLGDNDILNGNDGNDVLIGGSGNDTMSGGSGSDTFRYTSGDEIGSVDIITDFAPDEDILDLSALLGSGYDGTNAADYVKLVENGGNTTVQVDVDGTDSGVNFADLATLQGVTGETLGSIDIIYPPVPPVLT